MSDRQFCRDSSLAVEEPLAGTASTVRRWLLVERNGPWGRDALSDNRLGPADRERLRAIGREAGARVLLIRRHGRYEQRGFRVIAAFTGLRRRWLEEFEVDEVDEILDHDFLPLRSGRSVGGRSVSALRFFVCTHGTHDPCCAKHGRPVAGALQRVFPEETWEVSHIGGDRFAGNVLVLPLGIYYGRVSGSNAVPLMRRLSEGHLDLAHFRGRSCHPFAVQAAESVVREELSLLGVDDVALVRHAQDESDRLAATFQVRDADAQERFVTVELEIGTAPPAQLTCHAARDVAAPRYRALRVVEAG